MTSVCMIYGATGFTGRMILDAALARGLRPIVAGRSEEPVRALADRHQLPFRVFPVNDPAALAEALGDVDVLLNAAGPVSATAEPLARACIEHGVHYFDTGCELRILQKLAGLDDAAREAGIAIVPGMGFSPAAAEALAAHLKRRLPAAVRLVIALSTSTRPTRGILQSGLEIALRPSAALRRGQVRTLRRRRMRRFDFGLGPERCYELGWGELAAIHRATAVRNVDFFVRARPDLIRLLRLSPLIAACRGLPPVRSRFEAFVTAHSLHPPPEGLRKPGRSRLVGYAYDLAGQRAASRVHLPDPYTVTAALTAEALARAAATRPRAGVYTAGQYLGTDFLAGIPGLHVDWEELELTAPGEVKLRVRRQGRFPFLSLLPGARAERRKAAADKLTCAVKSVLSRITTKTLPAAPGESHNRISHDESETQENRSIETNEGLQRTGSG